MRQSSFYWVMPTLTLLEVTVPPPDEGAEAVTVNITGIGVGLSVPTEKACP